MLSHIAEHINLLRTTDPDLLNHIGEQPLAPPQQQGGGGGPQGPGGPQGQPNPNMPKGAMGTNPNVMQQQNDTPDIKLPNPAQPPAPFKNNPTDPKDMLPQS